MRRKPYPLVAAVAVAVVLLAACGDHPDRQAARFDAHAIAEAANNGQLAPLIELQSACSEEVDRLRKRGPVCSVLDRVAEKRKPLDIRF